MEIPFPEEYRIGNVFCMIVFDLDYENLEYGYRMDGPHDPIAGHRFDKNKILCDPYAKVIGGRDIWLQPPDNVNIYQHRARLAFEDFDREDNHPLDKPIEDLVVYEAHVRGFTRHPSAGLKHGGTFTTSGEKYRI